MSEATSSIDKFDRDILRLVQKSNRLTVEFIGEEIGLSTASVQRRLKRMRENGTILSDVSIVSREVLGRSMTFIIEITMERDNLELVDQFKKDVIKNDIVQQCYFITGNTDCILIVTADSMDGYDHFSRNFLYNNQNIRGFRTSVVMDSTKIGLFIPTEESVDKTV